MNKVIMADKDAKALYKQECRLISEKEKVRTRVELNVSTLNLIE